jgi:hypothetical protein
MIANLPSSVIAREFGLALFAERIDPSDPEDCLNYLMMHFGLRWREIIANQKSAMDYAGQMYIDADIARRVA